MVTGAVNMGLNEIEDAPGAQEKLENVLAKINANLQTASHALAQTQEQKMKRDLADAKELMANAERLADANAVDGKPAGAKPGQKDDAGRADAEGANKGGDDLAQATQKNANKADGKGAEGANKGGDDKAQAAQKNADKAEGKGADGANKPNDAGANKGGDDKAQAAQKNNDKADGKGADGKADNTAADKGQPSDKQNGEGGDKNQANADGKQQPLTQEQKRQLAAELQRGTVRLAKRLEDDKLDAGAMAQVKASLEAIKSLQEATAEAKRTKLKDYVGSLRAVSGQLESKLESTLKARRLSAAQREETPAQYREMVKSYYEVLAKE
jgi:hypothetical protein